MAWLELSVALPASATAAVESRLEDIGALSITLSDAADQPLLEPGVGETPLWANVVLTALFDEGTPREPVVRALSDMADVDTDALEWRDVADQAWERVWLDRFAPQSFGARLWVVPGEHDTPDDAAVVRLDPGLAFGTGDHPTTAMCLEWLGNRDNLTDQRVLDFGCGSGILAIAACKLGALDVTALDNDPQALIATRDNAARNNVAHSIDVIPAPLAEVPPFDLVLANILAGPLVALATTLTRALKPGGALVLSGLLAEQADEVAAAYAPAVTFAPPTTRDDWIRLDGVRAA